MNIDDKKMKNALYWDAKLVKMGEPSKQFSQEARWNVEDVILRALDNWYLDNGKKAYTMDFEDIVGRNGMALDAVEQQRLFLAALLADQEVNPDKGVLAELTEEERFDAWMRALRDYYERWNDTFGDVRTCYIKRKRIVHRFLLSIAELWRYRLISSASEARVLMDLHFGRAADEDIRLQMEGDGIVDGTKIVRKGRGKYMGSIDGQTVLENWQSVARFAGCVDRDMPEKARAVIDGMWSGPLGDYCVVNEDFKDNMTAFIVRWYPRDNGEEIDRCHDFAVVSVALREKFVNRFWSYYNFCTC